MKKFIIIALLSAILVTPAYAYWTAKLDAQATIPVVYSVDIHIEPIMCSLPDNEKIEPIQLEEAQEITQENAQELQDQNVPGEQEGNYENSEQVAD